MKAMIIFMIMVMLCLKISAQTHFEEKLPIKPTGLVKLKLDFADSIVFKTWNKSEVLVKVHVSINNDQHNDKFQLKVESFNGGVLFEEMIKDLKSLNTSQTLYDKDGNKVVVNNCVNTDLFYTIYIPEKVNIQLKSISGNIEGKGLSGELELKTISGDIDLAVGSSTKANLEFKNISGEVYTDFDLQANNKERFKHHFFNMNFKSRLNGGGKKITLNTISGDIFFRKL